MVADAPSRFAPNAPASEHSVPERSDEEACLVAFARLLSTYGTPAHRVETALGALARQWGLSASFFATPTSVFAAIEYGNRVSTRLVRIEPGDVDLNKLVLLDEALSDAVAGRADPRTARARLREIDAETPLYGPTPMIAAFALVGVAGARFFGGGWREMLVAAMIAAVVGVVAVVGGRVGRFARVTDFLAGLGAASLAVLAARGAAAGQMGAVDPALLMLAGLIVLLPGMTIAMAVSELAMRHVVAGSARLTGAAVGLLAMGFGAAIGANSAAFVADSLGWGAINTASVQLPGWTLLAALAVTPIGLAVVFRARLREALLFGVVGTTGFFVARFGSETVGPELGAFIGAVAVGVLSSLHSRVFHRPMALTTMPGLLLLVPGSIGFRSVRSFMEQDALSGVQAGFQVVMIAVAIVMGLLLVSAAMPPRRLL